MRSRRSDGHCQLHHKVEENGSRRSRQTAPRSLGGDRGSWHVDMEPGMRTICICIAVPLAGCSIDEGLVVHVHSPGSIDLSRKQDDNGRPRCLGNVEIWEFNNSTRTNQIWSYRPDPNSCTYVASFRAAGPRKNARSPLRHGSYVAFSGGEYGMVSVKFVIE